MPFASVHVVQSLDPRNGGTSVSVPALAHAIAMDGRYDSSLIHFGPNCSGEFSDVTTFSETSSNIQLMMPSRARTRLKSVVRTSDIVHVHGIWTQHCTAAVRAARTYGKPLMISAHGMLDTWALQHKWWKKVPYGAIVERGNLRAAACLRALTTVEAENYRAFGLRNPVAIIPNGVTIPEESSAEPFFKRFPGLRDQRLVLFFGRLHAKKGVHLLVDAWRQIEREFPDAHLVLAGPDDGALQLAMGSAADVLRESRITITGLLGGDVKWSALAASSLFVLPSYSEGLSMATLEALWAGLPILITRGCNFREVEAMACTFMTEPSVPAIGASLRDVLKRPKAELRERGSVGAAFVRRRYSWDTVGRQVADVYDWIRGGERPPCLQVD